MALRKVPAVTLPQLAAAKPLDVTADVQQLLIVVPPLPLHADVKLLVVMAAVLPLANQHAVANRNAVVAC